MRVQLIEAENTLLSTTQIIHTEQSSEKTFDMEAFNLAACYLAGVDTFQRPCKGRCCQHLSVHNFQLQPIFDKEKVMSDGETEFLVLPR